MSHLTLSILGFQEIAKLTFFNELLSIHYVMLALMNETFSVIFNHCACNISIVGA